ncbi:hypothetical protein HK107_00215 [Parvularcula sp. ZS-1/3]|uniref:Uncharacterized protein n=1 Tax=Parvularcula mediterranea TaxID=2732508 RepID=A0A7Y3RIJ8_9PROT|nr:hypothetical protein [Parvularcula mediterranea]NNU14744.1 hypothetical protein [Parvularcula mediterranea]
MSAADQTIDAIAKADDPDRAASLLRAEPEALPALQKAARAAGAVKVLHELSVLEAAKATGTTDTPKIEIRLQGHSVLAGRDHAYLMIIVDDHPAFAEDQRFQSVLEDGRRYATIGAGPRNMMPFFSDLVSGVNRKADLSDLLTDTFDVDVQHPEVNAGRVTERAIVDALFEADARYSDGLAYDILPFNWSDGYNSNSYVAGLLQATGWEVDRPGRVPGWHKPVPKEKFGK